MSKNNTPQHQDDDLDDLLDNVLGDFQKISTSSTDKKPPAKSQPTEAELDEELAKELAKGMDDLLKEMSAVDPKLKEEMESLLSGAINPGKSESTPSGPKNLDSRIDDIQSKLRDSSDKVKAEVGTGGLGEDTMAEMMKQMESMVDSAEFNTALEGMMEQLMSKDILYEPMKDLADRYPAWLENNKDKVSPEEFARFTKQYGIVKQIVDIYNATPGEESKPEDLKRVTDLMTEMQATGNPPTTIIQELAPDVEIGPDGQPKLPEWKPGQPGQPDCSIM